jgi:hypothetical protein
MKLAVDSVQTKRAQFIPGSGSIELADYGVFTQMGKKPSQRGIRPIPLKLEGLDYTVYVSRATGATEFLKTVFRDAQQRPVERWYKHVAARPI